MLPQDKFSTFFQQFVSLKAGGGGDATVASQEGANGTGAAAVGAGPAPMRPHERVAYLQFTINVFQSLENEVVRGLALRLVSLPLWHALSRGRLQLELHDQPQLARHWKHLAKKEAKAAAAAAAAAAGEAYTPVERRPEAAFLPALLEEFLGTLLGIVPGSPGGGAPAAVPAAAAPSLDRQALLYCERFAEFLVDLLSQVGSGG